MSQKLDTALATALISGDLSNLSVEDRAKLYNQVCESTGLNPASRPFELVKLNNKLTLYARKDATDQLRKIHGVSITTREEKLSDIYLIHVVATDRSGRTDADVGAVTLGNLKGDALANAVMKAYTKAKRRVTLSICGLGFLDETELETIPGVVTPVPLQIPLHIPQLQREEVEQEQPQKPAFVTPNLKEWKSEDDAIVWAASQLPDFDLQDLKKEYENTPLINGKRAQAWVAKVADLSGFHRG